MLGLVSSPIMPATVGSFYWWGVNSEITISLSIQGAGLGPLGDYFPILKFLTQYFLNFLTLIFFNTIFMENLIFFVLKILVLKILVLKNAVY